MPRSRHAELAVFVLISKENKTLYRTGYIRRKYHGRDSFMSTVIFEVLFTDCSGQILIPSLRVKYSKKNSRSAKLRSTKSQKSKDLKYTVRGIPKSGRVLHESVNFVWFSVAHFNTRGSSIMAPLVKLSRPK